MRDRLFLALMEGEDPHTARTVLATEDPVLVRTFIRALPHRFGLAARRHVPHLEPDEGDR